MRHRKGHLEGPAVCGNMLSTDDLQTNWATPVSLKTLRVIMASEENRVIQVSDGTSFSHLEDMFANLFIYQVSSNFLTSSRFTKELRI